MHVAMDCHTDAPRTTVWDRDLLDSFLLSSGIQPLAVMAELLGWPAADTLTSAEVTQTRKDDIFVTADFTTRTTRGSLRMSNTRNRFAFETTVTCADGWSVSWTLDEVAVYRPGAHEEPPPDLQPAAVRGREGGVLRRRPRVPRRLPRQGRERVHGRAEPGRHGVDRAAAGLARSGPVNAASIPAYLAGSVSSPSWMGR